MPVVEADYPRHAPEASTGSRPAENLNYPNFNAKEWKTIYFNQPQIHPDKPTRYTVANLIEDNAGGRIARFYADEVEFGNLNIHDEISTDIAEKKTNEHKNEHHTDDHEIGHLFVAWYYGYDATATSIPGPGYNGMTRWSFSGGESDRTRLWRSVVIAEGGAIGAGDTRGAGSDHGKSRYLAQLLSYYFREGSVSSILSSARSEAASIIQRGSRRFREYSRKLFHRKTI